MKNELIGVRPFPLDPERKMRCMQVLRSYDMSITELAEHIGIKKTNLSNIISGRELSSMYEERIASFLEIEKDVLFPPRTPAEIAEMRKKEAAEKKIAQKKKSKLMQKKG